MTFDKGQQQLFALNAARMSEGAEPMVRFSARVEAVCFPQAPMGPKEDQRGPGPFHTSHCSALRP